MIDLHLWMYKGTTRELREQVLTRDRRRCTECGTNAQLQVHHIIPVRKGGGNELANLKTVCAKCHKLIEPPWKLYEREGVRVGSGDRTMMKMDSDTHFALWRLAREENRSMVREVRFLVEERARQLGVLLE